MKCSRFLSGPTRRRAPLPRLKTGEQLTVGELLYGLMLPSGNDAAVALAEHFGTRLLRNAKGKAPTTKTTATWMRTPALSPK